MTLSFLQRLPMVGALNDPDTAPLRQRILSLAWPSLVENLLQTMLGVADLIMVGRLGEDAIAGVGLALTVMNLLIVTFSGLSMGNMAMVARFVGGGRPDKAEKAAKQSLLIAAIISGFLMGLGPGKIVAEYGKTIRICAYSLLTISAMLAIGTLTRLSGIDATLGLAFAATGVLYPFFGTLLGWLGVALTGSDTASNILFGNLQKITSTQLGISPILMGAANSSGGVMGKMIDAQSIVVASTATNWFGHEGTILRFVFLHSITLACLVGLLVMAQAYIFPWMIVAGP